MLYIKDYNGESVRDLLEYFLFPFSKTTYSDKNYTVIDRTGCTRRSLKALVELVNTYYPNTSEKEVLKIMRQINRDGGIKNKLIFGHYCNDVGGAVFSATDDVDLSPKRILTSNFNFYNWKGYTNKQVVDMKRDDHKSINDIRKIIKSIR